MKISSYGASAQNMQVQRAGQTRQTRPSSGFGESVHNELQKDQVSISQAGRTAQAGVLSASEKTFFNDSFGMNVFGADTANVSVLGNQAAKVLNSQEINFFQNAFGENSQVDGYSRSGHGQAGLSKNGSAVNMMV